MRLKLLQCLPVLLVLCLPRLSAQQLDNEQMLDLIQNQRYKEAAAYIRSVYPGEIGDPKIVARLAYCSLLAGDLPEAEKNYLLLYAKDSLDSKVLYNLANLYSRKGNYPSAQRYYREILRQDSTNISVYKQLADIGEVTQDTNRVRYLEKANQLNTIDPDVAYDLGNAYIKLKKFKQAGKVLDAAIAADTTNLLLFRTRAKLAYALDQWTDVVTISERLVKEGEESAQVMNWLTEGYYRLKKYRESIATCKLLEEREQQNEAALYFAARSYKSLGEHKNAIQYFDRAIREGISPNIKSYYQEIGDSFQEINQPKTALVNYKKSKDFEAFATKEDPLLLYYMATIYDQKLNDKTNALNYYKRFVAGSSEKGALKEYYLYSKARIEALRLASSK